MRSHLQMSPRGHHSGGYYGRPQFETPHAYQLGEVVGESGRDEPHEGDHRIVNERRVLADEAIEPELVTTERLHDEQVGELVLVLLEVDLLEP